MLSHTGEKPFICKQCNYLFVYLHIRHPGTSFLRSSYNYIFKNIAYVIVYVWPSRTWDEILLPFQKGLFFPLGDIRLFLPTRIRICAYAHHPTWIRHGRIRMAIPNWYMWHNCDTMMLYPLWYITYITYITHITYIAYITYNLYNCITSPYPVIPESVLIATTVLGKNKIVIVILTI